jgi:hypothetical protein
MGRKDETNIKRNLTFRADWPDSMIFRYPQ